MSSRGGRLLVSPVSLVASDHDGRRSDQAREVMIVCHMLHERARGTKEKASVFVISRVPTRSIYPYLPPSLSHIPRHPMEKSPPERASALSRVKVCRVSFTGVGACAYA